MSAKSIGQIAYEAINASHPNPAPVPWASMDPLCRAAYEAGAEAAITVARDRVTTAAADSAEAKPCCKCEAHSEIAREQARENARLVKALDDIKSWRKTLDRFIGEGLKEKWS